MSRGDDLLRQAVEDLKESGRCTPALSSARRAAIVRAAYEDRQVARPLPSLFTPLYKLILAGTLPVLVLGAAVLMLARDRQSQGVEGDLQAFKIGSQVVFTVDSATEFTVTKSTDPNNFDRGSSIRVTGGAYADRTSQGSSVVYYRIEE